MEIIIGITIGIVFSALVGVVWFKIYKKFQHIEQGAENRFVYMRELSTSVEGSIDRRFDAVYRTLDNLETRMNQLENNPTSKQQLNG
jgi:hypothetical protein